MNKTLKDLVLSAAGFAMAFALLPQTVFAGETKPEDYVIEKDDETMTCKITGYEGSSIKLDIPETIDGYKVTSIGSSAFGDTKVKITSVELPKYVTTLEDKAFEGCEDLVSVRFHSSYYIKSIGSYAFNKCKSLADIYLPSSITSIGEGAFMQCTTLQSVTIPSGVTDIPSTAFKYDAALKSVSIEDGVKTIGEEAFFLSGIEKITMPASIESIGKRAFYNTGSIEVTFLGGVKSIDDSAFETGDDYELEGIYFIADGNNPGDVKRFAQAGLARVKYYYTITTSQSVLNKAGIGVYGTKQYNEKSYLAGDTITLNLYPGKKYRLVKWAAEPSTVKFSSDILLTVTFRMPNANVVLNPEFVELFDISFYDEDGTTLLYKDVFAAGDTVIYAGATPTKKSDKDYIYKFDHWSPELGKVTADTSYKAVYKAIPIVTEIEPTYTPVPSPGVSVAPTETPVPTNTPAVTATPAADPTTAPSTKQSTGFVIKGKNAVFTKPAVVNASKVTIPATVKISGKTYKVTEIKDNAFKGNTDLTQVTIGKNVTKIGKGAFNGCKKLKKITIKGKVKTIGKNAFKGIFKKAKFTLPKKNAKALKKLIKKAGFKI